MDLRYYECQILYDFIFTKVDPKNQIFIDVLNKYYNEEFDKVTLDKLGE